MLHPRRDHDYVTKGGFGDPQKRYYMIMLQILPQHRFSDECLSRDMSTLHDKPLYVLTFSAQFKSSALLSDAIRMRFNATFMPRKSPQKTSAKPPDIGTWSRHCTSTSSKLVGSTLYSSAIFNERRWDKGRGEVKLKLGDELRSAEDSIPYEQM